MYPVARAAYVRRRARPPPLSCRAPVRGARRTPHQRPVTRRRWRNCGICDSVNAGVFAAISSLSFSTFTYTHHRRDIKLWTLARKDVRRLHCSATHGVSQNGGLFRDKARAFDQSTYRLFFKEDLPGLQPLILQMFQVSLLE